MSTASVAEADRAEVDASTAVPRRLEPRRVAAPARRACAATSAPASRHDRARPRERAALVRRQRGARCSRAAARRRPASTARGRRRRSTRTGRRLDHAGAALEPRVPGARRRPPTPAAPLEPDGAPRPDRGGRRRPAGRAAEQGRAEPAQLLVLDHRRAPARPRAPRGERGVERAAADHELVVAGERHDPLVRHEHVVARRAAARRSSQTSASVARPSKPSTSSSAPPRAVRRGGKRARHHQSSASKRRAGPSGVQAPAARSAAATVDGARAGDHPLSGSAAGPDRAPGGVGDLPPVVRASRKPRAILRAMPRALRHAAARARRRTGRRLRGGFCPARVTAGSARRSPRASASCSRTRRA